MRLRHGTRARFTLADGSTLEGTVQRAWQWKAWRLAKVQALTSTGAASAAGRFIVPKRAVLFVQVLHVEVDADGAEG